MDPGVESLDRCVITGLTSRYQLCIEQLLLIVPMATLGLHQQCSEVCVEINETFNSTQWDVYNNKELEYMSVNSYSEEVSWKNKA